VFVRQHTKDLAVAYAVRNKNFPFRPSVKKTPMSETDVTLAWIDIYGLIASKGTVKQESGKDIIMQNCSIKRRLQARKILHCRTAW
jgi:hypothetical protein